MEIYVEKNFNSNYISFNKYKLRDIPYLSLYNYFLISRENFYFWYYHLYNFLLILNRTFTLSLESLGSVFNSNTTCFVFRYRIILSICYLF